MDVRRLRIGEWITGFAGVALLAVMPVHWFEAGDTGEGAWAAFSAIDILLAVVATMAIAVAVMAAAHNTPAVSLAIASLLLLVGAIATIVLLVRAVNPPEVASGADTSLAAGFWLGLAATALATGGALASMRDESFPRGARVEAPVETLPVPPEGGTA